MVLCVGLFFVIVGDNPGMNFDAPAFLDNKEDTTTDHGEGVNYILLKSF